MIKSIIIIVSARFMSTINLDKHKSKLVIFSIIITLFGHVSMTISLLVMMTKAVDEPFLCY